MLLYRVYVVLFYDSSCSYGRIVTCTISDKLS